MRRSPAVGQHLLQAQGVRMQAEKKVAHVAPRLDPMTLGAGEDRQARSTFKITADLARRLERIMVVCRGDTVPTE